MRNAGEAPGADGSARCTNLGCQSQGYAGSTSARAGTSARRPTRVPSRTELTVPTQLPPRAPTVVVASFGSQGVWHARGEARPRKSWRDGPAAAHDPARPPAAG